MGQHIRLEVIPWLTTAFGAPVTQRLLLNEEVEEKTTVGHLLARLARHYQGFADVALDPQTMEPTGQVSIILNGRLLELAGGTQAEVRDGDILTLLPAYAGGAPTTIDALPSARRARSARSSADRASVFGTEGRGFESLRARHTDCRDRKLGVAI